jgi:hypothetical protein
MPSAMQVNENEKRKHASLTIVEARWNFALRIARQSEEPGRRYLEQYCLRTQGKGRNVWGLRKRILFPPTVEGAYPSG